jgi:choline-sulfatase
MPEYGMDNETARHPRAVDLRTHFQTEHFTEEQIRGQRRGYLACVTFVDRQLARLIEALKSSGHLDRTNVIYTSDHGEMLGEFGMWWKCALYEDSARIPCIAAGPDFSGGRRSRCPVDLHDAQASLFAATGADRPAGWVGAPLQSIPEEDADRVVFSEYHGHGARESSFMIRRGNWKYLHHFNAPHQLFNLSEDPHELRNLCHSYPAPRPWNRRCVASVIRNGKMTAPPDLSKNRSPRSKPIDIEDYLF